MGGDRRTRLPEHRAAVSELVAKQPDLTLQEIRGALAAEHGIAVGLTSVWRFLKAQQITLKKRVDTPPSRIAPDIAEARRAFIRRQPALDPTHLVFIDETWAATNMVRRYGRAARGLRLLAPVPLGHWKVTTLVAGLRCSGIAAPCVFDGAINGERFRAYVEQMLAPTLWPDDIVLLDNLSSHKAAGVAEAITAQGARLVYLPPYSPDLNPIEQAFAKFKAALRHAAERTREGLWQAIGRTLDRYQPQECRNFFRNAGYPI